MSKKKSRSPTGIKEFDKIIEGGFPKNSSVLICGGPGTGKSIFSMQYFVNGAKKYGEKGLYISFEQKEESIKEQASQFGWDLDKLEKKNKLEVMSVPVENISKKTIDKIEKKIKDENIKRVVIDSLSTLVINAPIFSSVSDLSVEDVIGDNSVFSPPIVGDYFVQKFLYKFIDGLRDLDCTSLLIAEADPSGDYISRDTLSEFVCDGVVLLSLQEMLDMRRIKVRKMRGTRHTLNARELKITKKGIEVVGSALSNKK